MSDNQCANCLNRDLCPGVIKIFCGGMTDRECPGKERADWYMKGDYKYEQLSKKSH